MANTNLLDYEDCSHCQDFLDSILCPALLIDRSRNHVLKSRAAEEFFAEEGIDAHDFIEIINKHIDDNKSHSKFYEKIGTTEIICNIFSWVKDGSPKGSACYFYKLTESFFDDEEMQWEEEMIGLRKIDELMEVAYDGFGVVDAAGTIIQMNTAMAKVFGGAEKWEMIGKTSAEHIKSGRYKKSVSSMVAKSRKTESLIHLCGDKEILITGVPVYDKNGNFKCTIINSRDVTELRNLQHDLEYQKMLTEGYKNELVLNHQTSYGSDIIFVSNEMKKALNTAKIISNVDATVLVTGESGVGKEVIVNYICKASCRKNKPLIKINCGAIPHGLFESEMFGYEEGAFTGAKRRGKAGFFELANGGTLFLDEVGELSIESQVKLLRVLQEKEVVRIGGLTPIKVDVRIISATNQDLKELVGQNKFRRDLYYRLNVVNINVPPLRERRDDIIPLAMHFIEKFNKKYSKAKVLTLELAQALRGLNWVGNIRELQNLMENLVLLVPEDRLELCHLYERNNDESIYEPKVEVSGIMKMEEAVEQTMNQLINNAFAKYGTTKEVAKALGVDRSTISRKCSRAKQVSSNPRA